MEKYFNMLKEMGIITAKTIEAKTIKTAPWVIYKCKFGCDGYGQSLCCPPNSFTYKETQEIIDCFDNAILFHSHDMDIMNEAANKIARQLYLDGYYKVVAFGSGPCTNCEECDLEECKFPYKRVPSMESCGIDVFATVRANGFEINTLPNEEGTPNCFCAVLVD